ncbi:hypothetical protein [Prevotella sp. 10(H)]|uniref:hypothetical protein n=1 Tax=Prevotella sp. 10(H) TaxID=1158294 RepID=UPI0012DF08EE|nr:hypothetical protein [Prevotella sp. 10(H)]
MYNEDLSYHARFSLEIMKGERPMFGNFLLYMLVPVFAGFSKSLLYHKISLCFLIAIATTIKFVWAKNKINEIGLFSYDISKRYWMSVLIAFSLIFVYVIPIPSYLLFDRFYLGNFVPNTWHNSTTIFLFPFAILLFYQSYKQIVEYDSKRNIIILILMIVNIFIKPSFFFVFICVYPLFMFIRHKLSKPFWISLLILFIGGLCLALEYFSIYLIGKDETQASSVVINIFFCYENFSPLSMLPFAIIFSLLFPLVYYIMNYKKRKKDILTWYILAMLIVSFLIYFILAESGLRATHGNFYWQIIICVWIFYFYALFFLLKDIKDQGFSLKNKILTGLYSVHVLLGLIYVIRLYSIGSAFLA